MNTMLSGCGAGCETDINTKCANVVRFRSWVDIIDAGRHVCFWG